MAITDVVIAVVAIKLCFFASLLPVLCQDPTDISHGCYFDGVDRALQDLVRCTDDMGVCQESCGNDQTYCEGETGMTVDFCRGLCRNRNLQYYALEAGKRCFCGGALSEPFQYSEFTANPVNCSYPCSGDANQTCGGDFKMEIYEFNDPVPGADCFHPGFVPKAYVSHNLAPKIGEKVTFLCAPGHMILGDPQLTCMTQRAWSPNVLPVCTGIFLDSTTQSPPDNQSETTTPASTTLKEVTPTTLPLQTITDISHGCYFDGVDMALQDLVTCTDGMGVCQESCGNDQTYCEGETGMTVDFCRGLCRNRNLQYYALQSGNQCFCGGALSEPFQYTEYTANPANCSYPCSGDANQTCGGDFKMEIYEFNDPVPDADCFHPGFVPNAYVSDNLAPKIGEIVTFLCEPGYMILGDPQLTCMTQRAWSPNVLPVCNYTEIFPDSTTQSPTDNQSTTQSPTDNQSTTQSPTYNQSETTTPASTTLKEVTPTTLPLQTITDILLFVGILIGVAFSVITVLLIVLIAKTIRHTRQRKGTTPPDPKQNSSTLGHSERRHSADAYYNTVEEHPYEDNLKGLKNV